MQADAILAMQLQRLTGLEADKLAQEYAGLKADITHYEGILADERLILEMIGNDLRELKDKYDNPRRSAISDEELGDYDKESLIREEYMVVTVTHDGYIKARLPPPTVPKAEAAEELPRPTLVKATFLSTCLSRLRTTTSCSLPIMAGCTGSRSTIYPWQPAPLVVGRSSTSSSFPKGKK